MERIGIYGGSFNPPHMGHIQAAKCAADTLNLDKLLMIPARVAPHKQLAEGSPEPAQRLEMTRIAIESVGDPRLQVSDLELNRDGVSYTWQTIREVRKMYPEAELFLLMGTDMFLSFQSWKKPEQITREAALGVFYRGDKEERERIEEQKQKLEDHGAKVVLVDNPVIAISSTQLRRMLVFQCAEPFLPAGVGDYIRALRYGPGLPGSAYGAAGAGGGESAESEPGGSCAGLPGYGGGACEAMGRRCNGCCQSRCAP